MLPVIGLPMKSISKITPNDVIDSLSRLFEASEIRREGDDGVPI